MTIIVSIRWQVKRAAEKARRGMQQLHDYYSFIMGSVPIDSLYWYGGLLNYLIPSGGGEWAVVAPYVIPAAKELGVGLGTTVVTFAWADMMTDMIQPFWAIAMLAVARLHFRDIMGYLLMVFFVYFIITSIAFLFLVPNW